MSMKEKLLVSGVSKIFPGKKKNAADVTALKEINLSVQDGNLLSSWVLPAAENPHC